MVLPSPPPEVMLRKLNNTWPFNRWQSQHRSAISLSVHLFRINDDSEQRSNCCAIQPRGSGITESPRARSAPLHVALNYSSRPFPFLFASHADVTTELAQWHSTDGLAPPVQRPSWRNVGVNWSGDEATMSLLSHSSHVGVQD
jgi:hypothetical protein